MSANVLCPPPARCPRSAPFGSRGPCGRPRSPQMTNSRVVTVGARTRLGSPTGSSAAPRRVRRPAHCVPRTPRPWLPHALCSPWQRHPVNAAPSPLHLRRANRVVLAVDSPLTHNHHTHTHSLTLRTGCHTHHALIDTFGANLNGKMTTLRQRERPQVVVQHGAITHLFNGARKPSSPHTFNMVCQHGPPGGTSGAPACPGPLW